MRLAPILFLLMVLAALQTQGQILIPKNDYVPEVRQSRYSFALSLMSSGGSAFITYGIMRENPDSTHEVIFLTESSFIRQVAGAEKSRANPEAVDYFELYGIDPSVLGELWKLKHDVDPYGPAEGYGTANGTPSKGQYTMLRAFGISRLADYAFGDNLWLFLQKAGDPIWLGTYQMAR